MIVFYWIFGCLYLIFDTLLFDKISTFKLTQTNPMKNKIKTRNQFRALPIGCFIILLLNINLDCNSLYAASNHNYKLSFWLNSTIFSVIDSSGNDLLSVNYILNNKQLDTEEEFQLESWMVQFESYENSDFTDTYQNSLTEEVKNSYENWMSNPDLFLDNNNQDSAIDAIQEEEVIKFENWMINNSSWIELPCH